MIRSSDIKYLCSVVLIIVNDGENTILGRSKFHKQTPEKWNELW